MQDRPKTPDNHAHHAFFQQPDRLLHLVMQQQETDVLKYLEQLVLQSGDSWKEILRRRTITDPFDQKWVRISPLQFAVYSCNHTLKKAMISCIPNQFFGQALAQINAVSLIEAEDDGLTVRVHTERK